MKSEYLKDKQLLFLARFDQSRLTRVDELLAEFTREFPERQLTNMQIDNYIYGRYPIDRIRTFCYWMEKTLSSFGRIAGSPAFQYGVWYGTHGEDKNIKYRHTLKYGQSVNQAYSRIRQEIVNLLIAGANQDYTYIANCIIGEKFKGKILATYYPNFYLSIYAGVYLDDVLKYFNLDDQTSTSLPAIEKQRRLIEFKNNDPIMKGWTLMKFAMFLNDELYTFYYKDTAVKNDDERVPEFPNISEIDPQFVDFDIDETRNDKSKSAKNLIKGKTDYVKKTIRNKAIGDRGEQIVKFMEMRDLKELGLPKLANKVDWIAEREDGHGYDIISFEPNGEKKFIEVKATSKVTGNADFFISSNELDKSEKLKNYYIYYVYDVLSKNPKVWKVPNPFHPQKKGIVMTPRLFQVTIFKKTN